jgi:hypothetical protein
MERERPAALWFCLVVLAAISLVQLLYGVQYGRADTLVTVVLNAVFLTGLWFGHRWAYVMTLVLAWAGILATPIIDPRHTLMVLFCNGLVIVPLLMAARFFFPGRPGSDHI